MKCHSSVCCFQLTLKEALLTRCIVDNVLLTTVKGVELTFLSHNGELPPDLFSPLNEINRCTDSTGSNKHSLFLRILTWSLLLKMTTRYVCVFLEKNVPTNFRSSWSQMNFPLNHSNFPWLGSKMKQFSCFIVRSFSNFYSLHFVPSFLDELKGGFRVTWRSRCLVALTTK